MQNLPIICNNVRITPKAGESTEQKFAKYLADVRSMLCNDFGIGSQCEVVVHDAPSSDVKAIVSTLASAVQWQRISAADFATKANDLHLDERDGAEVEAAIAHHDQRLRDLQAAIDRAEQQTEQMLREQQQREEQARKDHEAQMNAICQQAPPPPPPPSTHHHVRVRLGPVKVRLW